MCALVRILIANLLLMLLAACSTTPVKAPVDARGITPEPEPQVRTHTRPAGGTTARARPLTPAKPVLPNRVSRDVYTVRRGDTLYSIAWQNGLKYQQLASMNGIRPPYTIYAGQRLRIGHPGRQAAATTAKLHRSHGAVTKPAGRPAPGVVSRTATRPVAETKPPAPAPAAEPVFPTVVKNWKWPARGPLLSGYQPDTTGRKGINIGGKEGQSVMAAAGGKVVYSGSGLVGYGRLIIIKHNDSLLSAYGHNSKLLVKEGEYVKPGQVIARMGSSGTDRTNLYFEIRKDGKPVNPLHYLPKG
jgi:lipoprotein NlpD